MYSEQKSLVFVSGFQMTIPEESFILGIGYAPSELFTAGHLSTPPRKSIIVLMDETKPTDEKPASLEPPKDIEELLKELPKVEVPKQPSGILSAPTNPLAKIPPKPVLPPSSPPPKPAVPPQQPKPPEPPKPVISAPKPTQAPNLVPSPDSDKFKSFVRTMNEDIEAAKKGMKPESKPFEIKPPPGEPKMAPPLPPPLKMPQMPQAKLGPSEKTRSFEMPKERAPLPPPSTPFQKKKFSLSPKFLILILVVAAVFAGAWWFMTREPEPVIVFTPTPTPTPTPKTLSELIPFSSQISISSTENFKTAFNNSIKTLVIAPGTLVLLDIADESNMRYELGEIISNLQLNIPIFGMGPQFVLFAYGQTEVFDNKGFPMLQNQSSATVKIGIIIEVSPLNFPDYSWEITMTEDLKNLFGFDPKKATSQTFLDNIYSGTDIRYRNFPYADSSIDYAIVSLPEFNADYFVLTSSRESIYSAIDLLLAQ